MPKMVMFLPLEDYNKLANVALPLEKNELYIHSSNTTFSGDQLEIGGQTFKAHHVEEIPALLKPSGDLMEPLIIVLPDMAVIEEIAAYYNPEASLYDMYWKANLHWDTTAVSTEKTLYGQAMDQSLRDLGLEVGAFYESRSASREEWYSMNGGFLFLGLFLGGLFTIGAALITYFKQVSEGYDDRERIQIMQKVGLDKETTRRATQSQILWMFVLPILTAAVHTAFAYPILQKMLVLFGITSPGLLIGVIVGVVIAFAVIYWLIYQITSKVYLRIVEK